MADLYVCPDCSTSFPNEAEFVEHAERFDHGHPKPEGDDVSQEAMYQAAPYPTELLDLVGALTYRPGWEFRLRTMVRDPGSSGLTLVVITIGYNSYHPDRGQTYGVQHYFPVPPATYDRRSWQAWLRARILDVEQHELNEFFTVDGVKPYAPSHGPGNDPYLTREVGTDVDARTSFRGELNS